VSGWNDHKPHDDPDELHDDLIETLEEVDHHLSLLAHLADDDTECNAEHDYTCKHQRRTAHV